MAWQWRVQPSVSSASKYGFTKAIFCRPNVARRARYSRSWLHSLVRFHPASVSPASAVVATVATTALAGLTLAGWKRTRLCSQLLLYLARLATFGRQNIAFVNPYFDADDTEGCTRHCQAIVNIGT